MDRALGVLIVMAFYACFLYWFVKYVNYRLGRKK